MHPQPEEMPPALTGAALVNEQISRLQQRQLEMVQQTAQELESLKLQLENSDQLEILQREVNQLKAERGSMEHYVQDLQKQMVAQQETATQTIAGLTDVIRIHLQQVKGFASQTEEYLEKLPHFTGSLPTLTPPVAPPIQEKPVVKAVAPQVFIPPAILPVEHTSLPARELPLKKIRGARTFSGRKFALRAVAIALVLSLGYAGVHAIQSHVSKANAEFGQVAGVSTVAASPSPDEYAASFADLPFSATKWSTVNSTDFGIKFDYPSNTSNFVTTIGGDNMWVLRHNGYLMKITRIESTDSLSAWWQINQSSYNTNELPAVTTTFKGQPALYVESKQKDTTSGSSYFVKQANNILQIWVKDEAATTDDGQRLTHMIDTFTFTS